MELNIHEKFNATLKEMMARKAPKDEIQKLIDDYRAQKDATVKSPESKTEVKKDDFVSSIPGLKEKLVKTQETKTPEVSVSSPKKTTATKVEEPITETVAETTEQAVLFDGFKFPEANYRYKEENGKAAWSKSTDGDKTFEVVDATNIPESWSKDPQFKLALAGQKGAATFAVGEDALNISIPTENIKPEVLVNTTIRPISDAELSMEEDEAIEAYKKSYGHLGFTFKTSGFGFDYVTIKHKNDTGKGITVSHDQWYFISESDKKEFNDYLGKYSKNLTQEQIDKTHNLSKHAQDIINIKSGRKTEEELKEIEQNAIDDIDGNSTMQKISNLLEDPNYQFLGLGPVQRFLSDIFDQKDISVKSAVQELTLKTTEYLNGKANPDYDPEFSEKMENASQFEKNEILRQYAIKYQKKKLTKEATDLEVDDYLGTISSESEDYNRARAEQEEDKIKKQLSEAEKNINKINILTDDYIKDEQKFIAFNNKIIDEINNGEGTVEENKAKLDILEKAKLALEDKRKFINSAKQSYASKLNELEDITYARDYLDNINSGTVNFFATLSVGAKDLVGTGFHLLGSAGDLVTPEEILFSTGPNVFSLTGDYLKQSADNNRQYLKNLPKGWNNLIEKGLLGVAENAPQLALAYATGGGSMLANMAVFGVSSGGDMHYSMTKEMESGEKLYSTSQMIIAPLAHGVFESIVMVPEMLMMRGAFKSSGKGFGGEKINIEYNPGLYNIIGNKLLGVTTPIAKGGGFELVQETATQVGQNWTQKVVLGNKDVQYADGLDTDFLIKVLGTTTAYTTAPMALQGTLLLANGMYLESDQIKMIKNSDELIKLGKEMHSINSRLETVESPEAAKELNSQKQELQKKIDQANLTSETTISNVLNRFGEMSIASVETLRELARKQSDLRNQAKDIRNDQSLTKFDKKNKLAELQKEFSAIEDNKAAIINNKNKYKLEHGNRINDLESKAKKNLQEKSNGVPPTIEQIEKEAERIFDEGNYDSDKRVRDAKQVVRDNIIKFESEALINGINTIDPNIPIEKFEANSLEEARDWLRQNLTEKGLSKEEIDDKVNEITEESWNKGSKGAGAYTFTPNVVGSKADPKTGAFDKHQIMIINAGKALAGDWTSRGHEILHTIVYKAFKASGKAFKPIAEAMLSRLEETDIKGYEWLMGKVNDRITNAGKGKGKVLNDNPTKDGRMSSYIDDSGNPTEHYYEEVMMAIADGLRAGRIILSPSMISRIKKGVTAAVKVVGITDNNQDLLINDAQDMLDILADYGKGLRKGEVSSSIEKLLKGEFKMADDIAIKSQKDKNDNTRKKSSMDFVSKGAKTIINAANDASRAMKAGDVNSAYQDSIDGKISSWEALNQIKEAYMPMIGKAIKQFENENNIKFDLDEIDTFIFEFIHSSRGVRGSLFKDPNSPNKKVFIPAEGRTPARYLNGLLPQRMIEFAIEAIPNLEEKYAQDLDALKDMEATETTIDQETFKERKTTSLKDLPIINERIISDVKKGIARIITRGFSDPLIAIDEILDNINNAIKTEYSKIIIKQMGTINSQGNRVIPSEEYKNFHADNFEMIVMGLPISTIKKKYSSLFNIAKLAREKDKKVNPITGEITYPGKGIFEIKPISKAKFGSYFLNSELSIYPTLLRARQKALAEEIAQSLAEDAAYEVAKDPEVIAKINDMQDIQGFSSMLGVENEIRNIGNKLNKKKTEASSLDVVKFSKDIGNLSEVEKQNLFQGLKKLGKAYAKYGTFSAAFEEAYPEPMFGQYRKSIKEDMDRYFSIYSRAKQLYEKASKKIPKTFEAYLIEEVKASDDLQAHKDLLGLGKGSLDFKDKKQLESVRIAVRKIAEELGVSEAQRFLRYLYSSGKIGGTTLTQGEYGLEYRGAEYFLSKIEKLEKAAAIIELDTSLSDEKKRQALEKNDKKIQKYIKSIEEGKEPVSHPYGLFENAEDFTDFVLKGLPGYVEKYKSDIPVNARQSVEVVNGNFVYKDNLASATANKKFLKRLMDTMKKLEADKEMSRNDIGMMMMALNVGMDTPLAAAAQVKYMTDDGVKSTAEHIYEHTIPRRIINMALTSYVTGLINESQLNNILNDFAVAVIPKDQAGIVDEYYKQSMPASWSIGKDVLDRYFNMLTFGTINMPLIDLSTGKINKKSTAFSAAAKIIKKDVKASMDFSNAIETSRTVNPAKGISVLDFDDTLATTKSGVRYTLPNPDGTPQPKKKVIFMAGGPGSGKSNVINQLGLKGQGFKVVNQDISLEWLMKNHGMPTDMREFTPEQASEFGKLSAEARGIALKKRIKYQGEGDGVIIDGTGASLNVMKKNIKDFQDKGYDVQMIFVETSQETALSRNKARKERSLRTGIVIKTHDSVQANKEAYKELFGERFAEVNTDNLKQGDVMPADVVNKVNDFTSGYIKGRLNAGEYATKGEELKQQGAEFDFSEFNQVVEGKTAPLFNKAMKLQEKFTSKDMFVLTARPAESNQAIFEFLQANGLNIPMENIVGLGSSLSSDKALWIAGKVGEGYNDFYFADDILENVQAVSDMLEQFDVKSKVQQAKRDFVLGDPKVKKLLDEKSMNDVKDVDGLANPGVYSNVKFSKSHRAEYENTVAKNRPDLSGKEVTATIDKMFEYIDGLDVPNKRKYEQITTKWLATSNIKLPEDSYKIQQAVEIAELKKEDIFSYKNPNEIIEKYAGTIKVKPISPVGIKEFTRATGFNDPIAEYGIVEYEVEETREAQQKVRDIVNTHWGPNSNPWCITKIDKDGNLSEDAWRDWTSYRKGPKRIVFQNGKLLAMKANYEYWGKMNKHSEGPIIQVKEGNVTNTTELVVGNGGIVDPIIRETRTVSKDGNTVTTNIFENSQDGYAEGTTIVENRIKGVKTKETRFDPDGSKVNTQEFDKKGKPTTSYQFNPNGKVKSVNGHLQQQAITEAGLDVNAREDADIDLTNELVVRVGDIVENNYTETETDGTTTDYFYGRVLVGDQVMEIGFESKTGLDLADVTKTIDGKTRLDIGKVIREVDPNVKGLPKTGVKFSKGISKEFNDIIEQSTGVGSEKVFSNAQAKIRGNKTRFDNIVPYSVQDLMGLLYNFVGRGKAGEQHMEFFKKALIDPFARAINELNQSKQSSAGDYSNLTKAFPNVKKKLNKEVESGDYTYDQAIRVYLWNKAGFEVPGLSKRDLNTLDSIVKNDTELQAFADALGLISKKEEGYAKPGEHWLVENIASDLLSDGSIGDARSEFLAEWQQNADEMFSKENLNKIQAIYGNKFREALEDILYRMKHGTNRPTGSSRLTNNFMNWINNSTGAIMFFNMRSALLQTLSTTNYINWTDNNPLQAAMAFANQKQYWSDFSALFNSDFLKQRRSGNQRSINEAELSAAVANSDNKAKAALAWLLQKGFLPTQIMDSFAISAGGATFYRNRINKYIKEGMTKEEAQEKAFLDFQEITEATQQSARPDMISQQQASPLGRLILSFQNTPMQYARIMNKAARDIVNGRGDQKSNISKIVYYGAIQSIIFAALQSAIFASLGDDEEEEFDKKKQRIVGSMVDGWLAGLGVAGKAIGTIERSIKEYLKQKERGFNADHAQTIIQLLGFSPPIGSKLRKIYSAIQTEEFNKGVSEKRGFTLDNPTWSSWGNVIEGFTNIPLGRISNKLLNIDNALDSQNQWWERAALLLGWNTWDLGIKDPDIIAVKGEIKEERKVEKKEEALIKKEEKKKEVEEENISKEKANIELQKKEIEDGNESPDCAAINKRGERCGTKIEKGSTYCTVHAKVEQSDGGKKAQCGKTKKNGERCKMQTSNKSGYCYYHD
jgi:hypothetical protein